MLGKQSCTSGYHHPLPMCCCALLSEAVLLGLRSDCRNAAPIVKQHGLCSYG